MGKKHERTLKAIFAEPIRANVNGSDVEAMLVAYGAELSEVKAHECGSCCMVCGPPFTVHIPRRRPTRVLSVPGAGS
jgi:hypothetical protein